MGGKNGGEYRINTRRLQEEFRHSGGSHGTQGPTASPARADLRSCPGGNSPASHGGRNVPPLRPMPAYPPDPSARAGRELRNSDAQGLTPGPKAWHKGGCLAQRSFDEATGIHQSCTQ